MTTNQSSSAIASNSFYVQALYAYSGADTASLSFRQGDLIEVLSTLESGWWDGVLCQEKIRGWFPSNYVQRVTEEEAEWAREQMSTWYDEENRRLSLASNSSSNGGNSSSSMSRKSSLDSNNSLNRSRSSIRRNGSLEEEEVRAEEEEDFWVPKVMETGQLFYYNTRTGETSRDMPIDGRGDGARIDHEDYPVDESEGSSENQFDDRQSVESRRLEGDWVSIRAGEDSDRYYYENTVTGDRTWSPPNTFSDNRASTMSGWTAKVPTNHTGDDSDRNSAYSDDSALDGNFRQPIEANVTSKESERTKSKNLPPPPPLSSTTSIQSQASPFKSTKILQPPLPPLLSELELAITRSLRELVSEAGMGAMIRQVEEDRNFESERDQLALLADQLTSSIRNLLLSSGALDSPQIQNEAAYKNNNQFPGVVPWQILPDTATYLALRPYTRQVTTGLSKLLMPIRALWGSLESNPLDQVLDSEDHSLLDDSSRAATFEEQKKLLDTWSFSNESRIEIEARLRSQLLSEATDLQGYVEDFLSHYQDILLAAFSNDTLVPSTSELRTSRCLTGAFNVTSSNFNSLDRSFGGNWKGQGFVTLPSTTDVSNPTNSYSYPSIALTKSVAASISEESKILVGQVNELKLLVAAADRNSSFATEFISQSSRLEQSIAVFLASVEDVNIATNVDIELSPKITTSSSHYAPYKSSIQEAIKFTVQLDSSKQSLYDVAHNFLFIIQEMFKNPPSCSTSSNVGHNISNGAQSSYTSPLLSSIPISSSRKDNQNSIIEALTELYSSTTSISRTLTSLAVIAEIQSQIPANLRQSSAVVHPTPLLSIKNSTILSSTTRNGFGHNKSDSISSQQSSTTTSTTHTEEEDDSTGSDSVDSDFFFPAGGRTRSSPSVRTRASSKAAQFFGSSVAIPTWEKRRSSNATSTSSLNSDSYSYRPRLPSDAENQSIHSSPTKSPSSKSKLAKLLGADAPEGKTGRSMSLPVKEPTPVWLLSDYGPDEVSFNMEGQIKGGTLQALVIAGASHEGRVDSNYLSAFLMTYRTFCTAHQLLDILIQRFLTKPPVGLNDQQMISWETLKLRPIRARVANFLKSWIRDHMDHDPYDPDLLHKIEDFAANTMKDPVQSPQIIKAVEDRLAGAAPRQVGNLAPGSLPPSIIPRNTRKLKLIDIDPLELARQLTIMDGRLFSRITPQECLGKAWPKEYGQDAPQITAMIAMSNAVTRWVTETILAQDDLKKRANTIKHFIYVAERCLALNNFSTLIHIIAGLNSTPVNRLRRTWETVSQKSMISLGILNNIMKQDKNYKEYREALRGVTPPCVPFLGVYLTDWTFIGDGNADMLRKKPHQINFQKRQKATELILMIKLHQSTTYNLAAVPVLVKWLTEQLYPANAGDPAQDDQRLYEISLTREPRERDDEKIARLLSESGFL